MNSLFKKLSVVLLAVIAAICMGVTLLLGRADSDMPTTAFAEDTAVKLNSSYLDIDNNGTLKGLTGNWQNAVGSNEFTISIPANVSLIDSGALSAAKLTGVTVESASSALRINSHAFQNSGLKYIEFSDRQLTVYLNAFEGCNKLNTIYMPAYSNDNKFDSKMFGTANVDSMPLLIAPDAASYKSYLEDENYSDNTTLYQRFAYKVELELRYGGKVYTDYRLGSDKTAVDNKDYYKYVLQADGKTWDNNGGMPVQKVYENVYETSVWYTDEAYADNSKIDAEDFNNLLSEFKNKLTLYAKSPELNLAARTHLTYSNKEFTFEEAYNSGSAVWTKELSDMCTISIAGYEPFETGDSTSNKIPTKIKNAGEYTLAINLKGESCGTLENPWTVKLTVNSANLSTSSLEWVSVTEISEGKYTGASLSPASPEYIFIYNNVPYFEPQKNSGTPDIIQVTNAYVVYNNISLKEQSTIALRMDVDYGLNSSGDYFEKVIYSGTSSTKNTGVYSATATVTSNNYIFENGKRTVTFNKEWYIMSSSVNGVIDRSGSAYELPSEWEYGEDVLKVPYAICGGNGYGGDITFELKNLSTGETVGDEQDQFAMKVNSSLSAGDYVLTINVGEYDDGDDKYEAVTKVYKFTIKNKVYANKLELPGYAEARATKPASYEFARIEGLTEWLDENAGFTAKFRIVSFKGDSVQYYTETDYRNTNSDAHKFAPKEVGVYTIFYEVGADGYEPFTGNFTYAVYDLIKLSDIQAEIDALDTSYTGNPVKPRLNDSRYYLVYLDGVDKDCAEAMNKLGIGGAAYIEAGKPTLAVALNDDYLLSNGRYLYRFVDSDEHWEADQKYQKATITIKSASDMLFTLDSDGWEYGDYSDSKIRILSYESVPQTSLENFNITINNLTRDKFNTLVPGTYYLTATNSNGGGRQVIPVIIKPAKFTLDVVPVINDWTYGNFKTGYAPTEPVLSERFSIFQKNLISNAEYRYYGWGHSILTKAQSIEDLLDKRGELPAGYYELVYSHKGSSNYEDFEYTVSFTVERAHNYWDESPVIGNWSYGDKSIDYVAYKPAFTAHFSETDNAPAVSFRSVDESGVPQGNWENSLADLNLDVYSNLDVGYYEVRITVPATTSYLDLEYIKTFEITKSQNGWIKVPSITGWNKGTIHAIGDVLTAEPENGTLLITITDKNDKVIIDGELPENINLNVLNGLGAGAYVLKAYVEGSYKFDELVAFVDFSVYGGSAVQTVLIVLVAILAVIAIALAIVTALLLIRKNKKDKQAAQTAAPAEASAVRSEQKPVQQYAQQHVQRPVQQYTQQPVQRPVQQQPAQPVQRPAQQYTQQPVQRPVQQQPVQPNRPSAENQDKQDKE